MEKTTRGLEALLGAPTEVTKEFYIKRLDTKFTIKALTSEELKSVGQRATIPDGKGGTKTDDEIFNAMVIVKGCIDPDFTDKTLRDHFGAQDDAECVIKALYPGEVLKLNAAILGLSGFGNDGELIEDSKN